MPGQDLRLDLRAVPPDAWHGHYYEDLEPVPVVHAAPDVHAAVRADRRRRADRRLAARLSAWSTTLSPRPCSTQTKGYSRPVVLLQDYHLYLAAELIRAKRRDALLLHFNHIPWPRSIPVAGAAAVPPARDLRGPAGERHRRAPDRSLRHELPRHGRRFRARRAGRSVRPACPLARSHDLGARVPDLHRSRFPGLVRARPGGGQRRAELPSRLERAGSPR